MRVATDVGGTFTDLVLCREDAHGAITGVSTVKVDTTPPDFERGVLDALRTADVAMDGLGLFVHGTTVVINALTERKGVVTGLITTEGFRDVLEIGRSNRPDLFNFAFRKPVPFVPRHLRREVPERLDVKGRVVREPDLSGLPAILDDFRAAGVEAVAVCLLHAYRNPAHEAAVAAEIARLWPEVTVTASHAVTREWREYERTSTAVLSAYVKPAAGRYLDRLRQRLEADGFRGRAYVMQSNGGIATLAAARANPIAMVESGPVGGMLAAAALGRLIGEPDVIALDIGGTTAKCTLIQGGEPRITTDYWIEQTPRTPGYAIKTPVIDIVEIGNGGGSIAWVDAGGALHVGPKSAGSTPGPVAYGRGGTEPTTTDANLLTGRINPDRFAGGAIVPDLPAVEAAFARVGSAFGADAVATARGVIRIANANMVNALKLVSLNRGHDPRDFALVAFGGGGAMHAAQLAAELAIPRVVIPVHAAVFSALGMLMSDLRRDYIRTRILRLDTAPPAELASLFDELAAEAGADFGEDGFAPETVLLTRHVDARYLGQEHTVKVPVPAGPLDAVAIADLVEAFHAAHRRAYTFALDAPVEIVNAHLVGVGQIAKLDLPPRPVTGRTVETARTGARRVDYDVDGIHDAAVYDRDALEPGMTLDGPALVEEGATVAVVPPGWTVRVDTFGNLILDRRTGGTPER